MKRLQHKTKKRPSKNRLSRPAQRKLPFIEHVYELRKRLFYVAISVFVFGGIAYAVERQIIAALLLPAKGQKFIYTSPGGGIDFLFRVCLYVGIAVSIPVIVYQLLRYLEPLIKKDSMRFITIGSIVSGILAAAGMAFGYFVGLPAALHFLLHQFVTSQIQPLLTIQAYMSFVSMYMLGASMLFQLPLILIFINRIKPLKPQQLFKYERWVILFAFVGGGIMNPSPNLIDQLMLAGPMIFMYQLGIGIIWFINKHHSRPKYVVELLEKDAQMRAERLERFRSAQTTWRQALQTASEASPVQATLASPQPKTASAPNRAAVRPRSVNRRFDGAAATRSRHYLEGFARPRPYRNFIGA